MFSGATAGSENVPRPRVVEAMEGLARADDRLALKVDADCAEVLSEAASACA